MDAKRGGRERIIKKVSQILEAYSLSLKPRMKTFKDMAKHKEHKKCYFSVLVLRAFHRKSSFSRTTADVVGAAGKELLLSFSFLNCF